MGLGFIGSKGLVFGGNCRYVKCFFVYSRSIVSKLWLVVFKVIKFIVNLF